MISRIILKNFKSFSSFEFNLIQNNSEKKAKNLALIYGENAIGKSSLVDAFALLAKLRNSIFSSKISTSLNFGLINNYMDKMNLNDQFYYNANEYIPIYKKIGSKDNMSLTYEFFISSKKYEYTILFDSTNIVGEKLLINGDLGFGVDRYGNANLPENLFKTEQLRNSIVGLFKMYFGKHSLLSCINYSFYDGDYDYLEKNIDKSIMHFLNELNLIKTYKDIGNMSYISDPNTNLLSTLVFGTYRNSDKKKLENTKKALSMYFSSIYSNVQYVDYDIETTSGNLRQYSLVFVEGKGSNQSRVPYRYASTGTKKLLDLFPIFYEVVAKNNIVVIDEIDAGINDILLKSIFTNLGEDVKGQLIVTTHNTLLLKSVNKKYIYLIDRDEEGIFSYSLDSFGRQIQNGTDIIGQYLKGLYGGVPQAGSFSMKYIVEEIDNEKRS